MGIMLWDLEGGFSTPLPIRAPRLTVRCEYPDTDMAPTVVTFGLSPSYGLLTARDAQAWLLRLMRTTRSSRLRRTSQGSSRFRFGLRRYGG